MGETLGESRVRRVAHDRGFTIIADGVLRDRRLSFRARGLLSYLLSLPDDWAISATRIATENPEGRDAIRASMGELEQHGYVLRPRVRGGDGTVRTVVMVDEAGGFTGVGFSGSGPISENEASSLLAPKPGNPASGGPGVLPSTSTEIPSPLFAPLEAGEHAHETPDGAARAERNRAASAAGRAMADARPPMEGRRPRRRAASPEADALTKRWWEASDPKPLGQHTFVAVRGMVDEALSKGWAAAEVAAALPRCAPPIVMWKLEQALTEVRGRAKTPANPAAARFWEHQGGSGGA